MRFTKTSKAISIFTALVLMSAAAMADNKCQPVGGMLMTNFGAIDASTTMGYATGDLKGAVSGTILDTAISGNNLVFHVQHHWVTESGDTLSFDPATATTTPVAPGLYAVVTYPVHLNGGTGKFARATGNLKVIGEADLNTGQLVFRYSGTVCSANGI
jgi:hypothetical protein